jgi:hypothetical protein
MDRLRLAAVMFLGGVLTAGTVAVATAGTRLAAPTLAIPAPAQVHPDPPVIVPPPPSAAEVVEAARRMRAAKAVKDSKEVGKQEAVWNDDNIPRIPRDITVVGHADATSGSALGADGSAAPPADAKVPGADAKSAAAVAAAQADASNREELTRLRERAADLERDADLQQRHFELDQNQISQNPDFGNDHAGQAKLKSEAGDVQAKHQQVDDVKRKIRDLEAHTKP